MPPGVDPLFIGHTIIDTNLVFQLAASLNDSVNRRRPGS